MVLKRLPPFLCILFLSALFLTTGCMRTAPVQDYNNIPFPAVSNILTKVKVEDAIVRAGAGLGWEITRVSEGQMQGTLHLRTHVAKVDILYTNNTYSIRYRDSTNLKFNDGKIHKNYNGWVQNLKTAINKELSAAQ